MELVRFLYSQKNKIIQSNSLRKNIFYKIEVFSYYNKNLDDRFIYITF